MNLKLRQHIEKLIFRATIKAALAKGYCVSIINNGGDEPEIRRSNSLKDIMKAFCLTDDDRIYLHKDKDSKAFAWIWFVYGNDGYDVISDYTTNLEEFLTPINELSDKLADKYC